MCQRIYSDFGYCEEYSCNRIRLKSGKSIFDHIESISRVENLNEPSKSYISDSTSNVEGPISDGDTSDTEEEYEEE